MPTHQLTPKNATAEEKQDVCIFAQTNFRNQMRRFGIKLDDRRRHMYIIGKTGMGKTTMMENMVLHDIYKGHGVGIVDPHGDFAEKIINYIPSDRINDIVYFNAGDTEHPIGFNILEVKNEEQKHLITAGLMGIFKKIWPDVWSSRMEYILNNTILALLNYPGSTLLGINRLLADKAYRRKVVRNLKDPVVRSFWEVEFANYPDRYMAEAVAPIQNKIGQFLSASVIRNMVAQVKSTIDIREAMDNKKILIMNLSKGRIGEDNSRLLGGMLITKIQLAAMERVDTPEEERVDFFLYVDEFQNFATPSFADILSEARKYRLSLIMAHQYVAQLDEVVADAVFGNVGTIICFRVGGADSEKLVSEFTPIFMEEDIVNLSKYTILLKLMIDGVASQPFSSVTMPPIGSPTDSAKKVILVSRERYGKKRDIIEDKIMRWSGMEISEEDGGQKTDGKKDQKGGSEKKKGGNKAKETKGGGKDREKIERKKNDNKQEKRKSQDKNRGNEKRAEQQKTEKREGGKEKEKTISLNDLLPPNRPGTIEQVLVDEDSAIKERSEEKRSGGEDKNKSAGYKGGDIKNNRRKNNDKSRDKNKRSDSGQQSSSKRKRKRRKRNKKKQKEVIETRRETIEPKKQEIQIPKKNNQNQNNSNNSQSSIQPNQIVKFD